MTNHIKSAISLSIKSLIYFLTRGLVINTKGEFKQYKRKLVWASTSFASLTNITLAILGANIKKKENISARLADILSWLYLITSTIREYENNTKKQDRILVDYICKYGFYKIQEAREDIIQNIPFLKLLNLFIRSNPIGIKPEDKLNKKIIDLLNDENNVNNLCDNLFIPNDKNEILYKLQEALILQKDAIEIFERIKYAIKHQTIKKSSFLDMIEESHNKGVITNEEYEKLKILFEKRMEVINVDYFNDKVYKKQR